MSDRPILFSAPMVRALIDGRKTQTRRILKPQPEQGFEPWQAEGGEWFLAGVETQMPITVRFAKGDRLWVRETFSGHHGYEAAGWPPRSWQAGDPIWYWADGNPTDGDWTKPKPGIHMPRWASRLTLTVTDVRVQRLQQCSREDAIAEGIQVGAPLPEVPDSAGDIYHDGVTDPLDGWTRNPLAAYANLWAYINGAGSWAANPWVVALTFTVERRNIDHE